VTLSGANTYTGPTTISAGTLALSGAGSITSSSMLTDNGTFNISASSGGGATLNALSGSGLVTLGSNTLGITGNGGSFAGAISGTGGLSLTAPGGTQTLTGTNTYTGATTINAGTVALSGSSSIASSSSVAVGANAGSAAFDISKTTSGTSIISLSGAADGAVNLGAQTLTITDGVGTFNGVITGSGGGLTVAGGSLILTGLNTYTGQTTVDNGAFLAGTGTIANLTVKAGGTVIPGFTSASNTTGTMNIQGSLVLSSSAAYIVTVNGSQNSTTKVSGTASIAGSNLSILANNVVLGQSYALLSSTSALSGTFATTTVLGTDDKARINYGSNGVAATFSPAQVSPSVLPAGFASFINAVNNNPALSGLFANLSPGALQVAASQASGQSNSGGTISVASLQNSFATTLLNPNIGSRGGTVGAFGPALGFAPDPVDQAPGQKVIYDALVPSEPLDALMRSLQPYYSHSVWASAYGGYSKFTGASDVGSPTSTNYGGGIASGIDYRFGPNTVAGLAVGGGSTSWNLSTGGGGTGNVFQVGAYGSQRSGNAYLSGSLAYVFDWMTTNRTVTSPAIATLSANFLASGPTGRLETGYRFPTPEMGITPYVAAEFSALSTPSYGETTTSGAQGFALNYAGQTSTNGRAEAGLWGDKELVFEDYTKLLLRGRIGYAHDWWSNDNFTAQFVSLPTQSFVMTGVTPPDNLGLITLMSEISYPSGISLGAKFDAELASGSYSFAGTATFRYRW
jgi:autotransporter-associated beta strand protein